MELNRQSLEIISKDWGLVPEGETNLEQILELLRSRLKLLLENDFEKLVNIMYRLDVNEGEFREALEQKSREEVIEALSMVVLKREIKRQEFRNRYKK